MRPDRELDARVAREIFGGGPVKPYSTEMEFAWDVARKMQISLIPINNGQWFAFCGGGRSWASPVDLLKYLDGGDFTECGAAVEASAAEAICKAAITVSEKRKILVERAAAASTRTEHELTKEASSLH